MSSTNSAATDIQRAKAASAALDVQERQLRLQERKGELINREAALAHVRRLASDERAALERFAIDRADAIGASLGADSDRVREVLQSHIRDHLDRRSGVRVEIDNV